MGNILQTIIIRKGVSKSDLIANVKDSDGQSKTIYSSFLNEHFFLVICTICVKIWSLKAKAVEQMLVP